MSVTGLSCNSGCEAVALHPALRLERQSDNQESRELHSYYGQWLAA